MEQIKIEYTGVYEMKLGGPFIGNIKINGIQLQGDYLVQENNVCNDAKRIALSKYSGMNDKGFFKKKLETTFHIIVYDISNQIYYQSIKSFELLAIEKMENSSIIFHESGQISDPKFRNEIIFNKETFKKVNSIF